MRPAPGVGKPLFFQYLRHVTITILSAAFDPHVLVARELAALDDEAPPRHSQRCGQKLDESRVRCALDRWCGEADAQSSGTLALHGIARSARLNPHAQQQVLAPSETPYAAFGAHVQRSRISSAWMAIPAHSGERSSPASEGMVRRMGRSTGSQSEVRSDCTGEGIPGAIMLSRA
jgi:hypothetical protein